MSGCCGIGRAAGWIGLGLLIGAAAGVGGALALNGAVRTPSAATFRGPTSLLPVSWLKDTAARGKNVSIATGRIDDTTEGLFVLDHLTGNLQCWSLNPRSGQIGIVYRTNVIADLGLQEKADPDYVLATGLFDFNAVGRAGPQRYAECVCYVGESSTGRFAGYSFAYNATEASRGAGQGGELVRVIAFSVRDEGMIRD